MSASSWGALAVLAVGLGALGAVLGELLAGRSLAGAGIGLAAAACLWFVAVLLAFRRESAAPESSSGRHRRRR